MLTIRYFYFHLFQVRRCNYWRETGTKTSRGNLCQEPLHYERISEKSEGDPSISSS